MEVSLEERCTQVCFCKDMFWNSTSSLKTFLFPAHRLVTQDFMNPCFFSSNGFSTWCRTVGDSQSGVGEMMCFWLTNINCVWMLLYSNISFHRCQQELCRHFAECGPVCRRLYTCTFIMTLWGFVSTQTLSSFLWSMIVIITLNEEQTEWQKEREHIYDRVFLLKARAALDNFNRRKI